MLRRWVRSVWEPGERTTQFLVLFRVFLTRMTDLELLSADADPSRLLAQFANVFIMISILLSVPIVMGVHNMPLTSRWTAEHFFIETTMTLAGLIAVLNWDSAFPDRRDVLVLAPLPVRANTVLLAKLCALFAAPGMAILALNLFVGVGWPLAFSAQGVGFFGSVRSWPAYWGTIALSGVFLVCTVLTVQGLAANLLPRQVFLRLSALLQAAALCLLLCGYFLEPSLESPAALTSPAHQRLLTWLPSYWFLGLFQQLNGSMHPALAPLARRAWVGLGASLLGAIAALLLSYFRMLPKTVEQPDILPGSHGSRWAPRFGFSLGSAITLFSVRTLMRSRQHRTILSFYLGLGVTLIVGYIRTPFAGLKPVSGISTAFLLAGIVIMILTVFAIRVVSSIPTSLRGNWILRVTQVRSASKYRSAVRVSWLLLGVTPVLLILSGWFLAGYPWRQVAGHLIAMLLFGALLVELCLATFRKIPFTCSYLPGKANLHFVFWTFLLFFIRLLKDAANFEWRMLQHLLGSAIMILFLALAVASGWAWSEFGASSEDELVFEEESPVDIVSLNLR